MPIPNALASYFPLSPTLILPPTFTFTNLSRSGVSWCKTVLKHESREWVKGKESKRLRVKETKSQKDKEVKGPFFETWMFMNWFIKKPLICFGTRNARNVQNLMGQLMRKLMGINGENFLEHEMFRIWTNEWKTKTGKKLFPAGTASYLCIHQVQSRSDWAAVRRSRWRIHRAIIERFISVYIGGKDTTFRRSSCVLQFSFAGFHYWYTDS